MDFFMSELPSLAGKCNELLLIPAHLIDAEDTKAINYYYMR